MPLHRAGGCPCSVFPYNPQISSCILSTAATLVSRKLSTPLLHTQELERRKKETSPERRSSRGLRVRTKGRTMLWVSMTLSLLAAEEAEEGAEMGARLSSLFCFLTSFLTSFLHLPHLPAGCTCPTLLMDCIPLQVRGSALCLEALLGRTAAGPCLSQQQSSPQTPKTGNPLKRNLCLYFLGRVDLPRTVVERTNEQMKA